MPLTFYPHAGDMESGTMAEKLDVLMKAAEQYKALVLDISKNTETVSDPKKQIAPREMQTAFNWDELAKMMREIREYPEGSQPHRLTKVDHLTKLSEVYEVLRGAKMPKLEAVRLALINEANQLRASGSTTAA